MARLCEGRVVIVTGAGRGIGREYALMLAAHGAKVVVNDLGGARDGTGASAGPAEEVVDEIRKAGGEAVANASDVSDFAGAKEMMQQSSSAFVRLDLLVTHAADRRPRYGQGQRGAEGAPASALDRADRHLAREHGVESRHRPRLRGLR